MLDREKGGGGQNHVCCVSTIWVLGSEVWKWRESHSISVTAVPQPKEVDVRVNWVVITRGLYLCFAKTCLVCVKGSQQCSDPSVCFSKFPHILSLMHNGKNKILLEKNQCVSYVFYVYILLGKRSIMSCQIFSSWGLIPNIASWCNDPKPVIFSPCSWEFQKLWLSHSISPAGKRKDSNVFLLK